MRARTGDTLPGGKSDPGGTAADSRLFVEAVPHGIAVARPPRAVRQVGRRLQAVPASAASGGPRVCFRHPVGGVLPRVRVRRRHGGPGAPEGGRRESIHVLSQARIRPFPGGGPGIGIGVFHSLSTSGRPSGQAERAGRKGAAVRLVRSGRQAAASAVLSSHTRRSRRGTFTVTTGFRMTAVTATLWHLPLSLSRT